MSAQSEVVAMPAAGPFVTAATMSEMSAAHRAFWLPLSQQSETASDVNCEIHANEEMMFLGHTKALVKRANILPTFCHLVGNDMLFLVECQNNVACNDWKKTNKQTNRQSSKQTNKETNKQRNKQANQRNSVSTYFISRWEIDDKPAFAGKSAVAFGLGKHLEMGIAHLLGSYD